MKRSSIVLLLSLIASTFALTSQAQDLSKFHLYDPKANAEKDIAQAVSDAAKTGKHVLIQVGGNWCIWCMRFNEFVTKDASLDSLVNASYVVYHLNWSKENMNDALLAKYGYPQRFGFPVFLVLNSKGELIHIQDSGLVEGPKKSETYDKEKVIGFLSNWSPAALRPEQYKTN